MLNCENVGKHSDIWGIGCIMYEMHYGYPVHYSLRHDDLSSQRCKVSVTFIKFETGLYFTLVFPEIKKNQLNLSLALINSTGQ